MQTYVLNKNHHTRDQVKANLHAFIDRLPDSKSWKVEIKEARKERTDPQNHALFGVAYPALEAATGFTKDELHDAFCRRFFGTVEKEIAGQVVSKPYRTTTTGPEGKRDVINAATFSEFYSMVQMVGAEAGIDVPSPVRDSDNELAQRYAA
jgi:hypothetical protein